MKNLSSKIEEEIENQKIEVRYAKTCQACSAIVRQVKGILVSIAESDAEDLEVGLKTSDYAWKLAHEVTHLDNYEETMYRPDEGTQIIKNKEELTDKLAIRQYIDEDNLLNCYIENCGNAEETAEDLEIPLTILQKAFCLYDEISEHFRERCAQINAHYLWAND